ncbi:MAG: discoidin domain-containing protein [Verrucomicrobiota bacterium]
MNKSAAKLSVFILLAAGVALAGDMVPLNTEIPKPVMLGTPVPIKLTKFEPEPKGKRPDFMVPAGCTNLALNKPVTSSTPDPITGSLDLVTDGDKAGDEGCYVELAPGKQWVQIDLGKQASIHAILVWHFHSQARAYLDVVAQVSDDPSFSKDVTTVFNSDDANELGLGTGKDMPYIESNQGKLIDAKGVKGRYVRLYSKGNTTNKMNHYIEVEVWGKPTP